MTDLKPGDRVRLSGKFLRSTGQSVGGEGQRIWTVKGISGGFVVVDEELSSAALKWFTAEELAADPLLRFRHFAPGNLVRVGTPSHRDC